MDVIAVASMPLLCLLIFEGDAQKKTQKRKNTMNVDEAERLGIALEVPDGDCPRCKASRYECGTRRSVRDVCGKVVFPSAKCWQRSEGQALDIIRGWNEEEALADNRAAKKQRLTMLEKKASRLRGRVLAAGWRALETDPHPIDDPEWVHPEDCGYTVTGHPHNCFCSRHSRHSLHNASAMASADEKTPPEESTL